MVLWHIQEIARMGQFKSKGKKLPDWKHPIFGKIGEYDVIEFPLQEAIKNISLASNNSLSESDKNRVADASLSRILFIKKKNEILVREIDYIPEWNYLQTNAFDLSGISVLSPMNEFTGHLVVQKWNGAFVARGLFEGGRLIKVGKLDIGNPYHRGTEEECTTVEFCIWQMDCEILIEGDQIVGEICGPWYNTGDCWSEILCEETDPCILYGIGCDENGNPDPGEDCSNAQEALNAIVASGNPTSQNEEIAVVSAGTETQTVSYKWRFFQIGSAISTVNFSSKETGVHVKNVFNTWIWQSLTHNTVIKTGTSILWTAECNSVDPEPLILGPFVAKMRLEYTISVNYICDILNLQTNNSYTSTSQEWIPQ